VVPEVRLSRTWFETPGERRAFLLVWGGIAALIAWYFFFGPRARYDYNWRWWVVWQQRRFLLWGIGTTLYIFAWSLAFGLRILIPSTFACILALSLYTGAYMGEVVRSGIRSIPRGQWEAATSTGLSRAQTWRSVVLPQALVIVIPPLSSEVLNIIKNSAVAMTIAITDLMFYSQKIEEETFAGFEAYTAGTLLFLLLTLLTVGAIYLLQRLLGLKVRTAG